MWAQPPAAGCSLCPWMENSWHVLSCPSISWHDTAFPSLSGHLLAHPSTSQPLSGESHVPACPRFSLQVPQASLFSGLISGYRECVSFWDGTGSTRSTRCHPQPFVATAAAPNQQLRKNLQELSSELGDFLLVWSRATSLGCEALEGVIFPCRSFPN